MVVGCPMDAPGAEAPYDDSIEYYDESLDIAHDEEGYLEAALIEMAHRQAAAWTHLHPARPGLWARLWWQARWVIYGAAFVLPLLVIGLGLGLLALLHRADLAPAVAPLPAPAPTAALFTPPWSPDLSFAGHTIPARIRDRLPAPGAQRGYTFEGQAGMTWTLAVLPYDESGIDPRLTLYDPAGALLCQGAECTLVLPLSGTYRVVIASASGAGVGLYLLTLEVQRQSG